jgi:16S rRNA (cytosine967-C5)-methyltransferase
VPRGRDEAAARRSTLLPRRTAYDVLAAVRDRQAYANLLLPRLLAQRQLTGRDAALATELAYGTLRGQGTYDAVLAACSDRPLDKLDPPVLDVLRLGTHQLLSTRVGAHAAVATSVDLARSVAGPRVAGYVNAVLRRVATRDLEAWLDVVAPPATDPDGALAVRYSHPRWIVAAYRAALGDRAAAELREALAAGNVRPKVTLAAFPAGPPRSAVMPADAEPGRWSPYAFTLDSGDPGPLIATGAATVQDEASQLAAIALAAAPVTPRRPRRDGGAEPGDHGGAEPGDHGEAEPGDHGEAEPGDHGDGEAGLTHSGDGDGGGELWLDMCAGPGGKSRLLYGLAQLPPDVTTAPRATLFSAELHPHRATLLSAELHPHRATLVKDTLAQSSHRLQDPQAQAREPAGEGAGGGAGELAPPEPRRSALASAPRTGKGKGFQVVVADGTKSAWREGTFDRVLVDVPCSGLGALRRRPEARWRKTPEEIPALAELQRELLRSALRAVRPGGVVAYVTCSPLPAETTDVVTAVATDGAKVNILDTPEVLGELPGVRSSSPQFAQLWPHRHGTDAIFIALLRRATE